MKTNMTEGQKKMIMVLLTVLFSVMILTLGINPTNKSIKKKVVVLEAEKKKANDMRTLISNTMLETNYKKLREKTELKFTQNYQSFKANEKIEEIVGEHGVELKSIEITEYGVIDPNTYELGVVQPKTQKEYGEMQTTIRGPLMELFLVSKIGITFETTKVQGLRVINAINNIQPEAPGSNDMARYCLQIPELSVDEKENGVTELQFNINMYGMKPPPLEEEAQGDSN